MWRLKGEEFSRSSCSHQYRCYGDIESVICRCNAFSRCSIFENIIISLFDWFLNRNHRISITWTLWLQNPMLYNSLVVVLFF